MAKKYKPESAKQIFHRYITGEEDQGEFRAYCPVCEDSMESKSPSASFNFDKGVWKCFGKCGQKGAIYTLVQQLKRDRGFNSRREMIQARNAEIGNPLLTFNKEQKSEKSDRCTEKNVTAWERRLHNSPAALSQLMDERGFTVETLRRFRVGWDNQRYTIPVYDEEGELCNVRRYKLGATGKQAKMLNLAGSGRARLFGVESLRGSEEIVLCEGETDRMLLEQVGIPAVTHTAGAATFRNDWGPLFSGKTVYICYDNDDTGRNGAIKAGKAIAPYADQVYQIEIPIPVKGADVSDYLHKEGHSEEDFRDLMKGARPMNPTKNVVPDEAPTSGKEVALRESMAESLQNDALEMTVSVSGKHDPPYKAPKRFNISCSMSKGPVCQQCPVFFRDGDMTIEIAKNDPDLFKFVGVADDKVPKLLKSLSGAMCTDRWEHQIDEAYYIEELLVTNSVDDRSSEEDQKPVQRTVFSVSTHATDVNTTIKVVGKNVSSPRDQRLSFMAWDLDPIQTSLDTFVLDDEMRKTLSAFQVDTTDPDKTPSALEKCKEIARDMSQNVTHIYGRELLHVAYDLVWHSPLAFSIDGREVEKGWLEMMVVGDTRTGKSETAKELARHYSSGVVKSCEGATLAGIVGGVQQINGQWFTNWGIVPMNDRRLVVLDEVSGLAEKNVIENMSAVRSSGRAEINKIDHQETSARTRLIWITNPADGVMIEERPGVGVDAMKTIVKNQEDIARFDFVMSAMASEVDSSVINSSRKSKKPKYTKEMCSALVLWAWSLTKDQVYFTPQAIKEGQKIAQQIAEEYVADPPLLQAENARYKIYRIAASLAARTFHIEWPEKGKMRLRVNADHVRDAKRFLDEIYDSNGMEYRSSSRRIIEARKRAARQYASCKLFLVENKDTVYATLKAVQQDSKFKGRDFEEFGGMNRDGALFAVSKLQEMGMIHRRSQGYIVMDKQLARLLREIESEGGL